MISLTCDTQNRQIHREREEQRLAGSGGVREKEKLLVDGYRVYGGDDEKVLGIHSSDSQTTL